jgi:hypothetical protein
VPFVGLSAGGGTGIGKGSSDVREINYNTAMSYALEVNAYEFTKSLFGGRDYNQLNKEEKERFLKVYEEKLYNDFEKLVEAKEKGLLQTDPNDYGASGNPVIKTLRKAGITIENTVEKAISGFSFFHGKKK